MSSTVAASASVPSFTAWAAVAPAAADSATAPNAPKTTFVNERFIALLMITESRKPDAPSSAPAMIRTLFDRTKPVDAAARPAYEFRSEMTTGMSAPPIGRTRSTPRQNPDPSIV